jgi:ABC-2 type transport system permease protein
MRKVWLVAKHEYLKLVRKRSFLLTVFGLPLVMVAVMAVSIFVTLQGMDDRPLGYVDRAGVLDPTVIPALQERQNLVEFRGYAGEEEARAALEAETIQGYYVLPEDYLQTGQASLYYLGDQPEENARNDFAEFARASLATQLPEDVAERLLAGFDLTARSSEGREIRPEGFILPFVAGFFFFFVVIMAGGYMLQAVSDEKENRTAEIMATSMSPEELVGGKALGLMGVSLTQLLIWGLVIALGLVVASRYIGFLSGLQVPWNMLLVVVLYFVPTFALVTGLMTALGAAVAETQQGQQISGIVNMLFVFPLFFSGLIFAQPDHPVIVALSLFPTSAFTTVLMRWGLTEIPLWQLAASWIIVVLSALGSVWIAARVYRLGMLRYGQRLRLGQILAGLRGQAIVREEENYA